MERETSKHGPLLDEEMKHETESLRRGSPSESRAGDDRLKEGPGEDQRTPEWDAGSTDETWRGQDMSSEEVDERREIARHLQPVVFPGGKKDLIASAQESAAPDGVIRRLQGLPDGRFDNVQAVWRALGGDVERRV